MAPLAWWDAAAAPGRRQRRTAWVWLLPAAVLTAPSSFCATSSTHPCPLVTVPHPKMPICRNAGSSLEGEESFQHLPGVPTLPASQQADQHASQAWQEAVQQKAALAQVGQERAAGRGGRGGVATKLSNLPA